MVCAKKYTLGDICLKAGRETALYHLKSANTVGLYQQTCYQKSHAKTGANRSHQKTDDALLQLQAL